MGINFLACCKRTRLNGFRLREGWFRLDLRKAFFTVRVVKYWHMLPREAVDALFLETFQVSLDGALSSHDLVEDVLVHHSEGLD